MGPPLKVLPCTLQQRPNSLYRLVLLDNRANKKRNGRVIIVSSVKDRHSSNDHAKEGPKSLPSMSHVTSACQRNQPVPFHRSEKAARSTLAANDFYSSKPKSFSKTDLTTFFPLVLPLMLCGTVPYKEPKLCKSTGRIDSQ